MEVVDIEFLLNEVDLWRQTSNSNKVPNTLVIISNFLTEIVTPSFQTEYARNVLKIWDIHTSSE